MKPDRATKGKAEPRPQANAPWVGVIMGSKSDLRFMQPAIDLLAELRIPHEARVVSAHRTPDWMFEYAATAESRGLEVIIAASIVSATRPELRERLREWRAQRTADVLGSTDLASRDNTT